MFKHTITITIVDDNATPKAFTDMLWMINIPHTVETHSKQLLAKGPKPKIKPPKPPKPPKISNLFNTDICEWITTDCIKGVKDKDSVMPDRDVTYGMAIDNSNLGIPILLFTLHLDTPVPFAENVKQHFQNKYPNAWWIRINRVPGKSFFNPNNKYKLKQWKEKEVGLLSQSDNLHSKIFTDLCNELWGI